MLSALNSAGCPGSNFVFKKSECGSTGDPLSSAKGKAGCFYVFRGFMDLTYQGTFNPAYNVEALTTLSNKGTGYSSAVSSANQKYFYFNSNGQASSQTDSNGGVFLLKTRCTGWTDTHTAYFQ